MAALVQIMVRHRIGDNPWLEALVHWRIYALSSVNILVFITIRMSTFLELGIFILQWRRMSVWCVRSPVIRVYVQHFVLGKIKETCKFRNTGPLWRESTEGGGDFLQKVSVMLKAFPNHNVVMRKWLQVHGIFSGNQQLGRKVNKSHAVGMCDCGRNSMNVCKLSTCEWNRIQVYDPYFGAAFTNMN